MKGSANRGLAPIILLCLLLRTDGYDKSKRRVERLGCQRFQL